LRGIGNCQVWTKARVIERRIDPGFDVPATISEWGNRFYLVNGRFGGPFGAERTVRRGSPCIRR
jgi:hypothetical protein